MEQLSLSGKRWLIQGQEMSGSLIDALRSHRGLEDYSSNAWCDPLIFPDAPKAAARVHEAIKKSEHIAIFGDYDCDGITATAQMLRFFRRHNIEPIVKLPQRIADGYGLKERHVQEFLDARVELLITVDTGVTAIDAISLAQKNGVDVIILDHHHINVVPPAFAILHPALATNFAPPHPSASGIVFLFLHALEGGDWDDRTTDLLLATFGTVADLVPLRGINRRLVQEGLAVATTLQDGPVRHLIESVTRGQPLTSVDIAFRIAPRINAAGRMGDPVLALNALMKGGDSLRQLERMNVERQEETAEDVCFSHRSIIH